MSTARPLALLFDLDGTLVDSVDLLLASFHHTFHTHLGAVPPEGEWIAGIGTPLVTQMRSLVSDELTVECMVATYRAFQREHHDRLLREFEGARETLAALRRGRHPTALVTSKSDELAHRALRFVGIDALIDVVVGFDSCARHKPDPEPVHVALRALGYAPEDAIFVGDSPHDIVAGNDAGVVSVAALWGPFTRAQLEAAQPAYFVERLSDLGPLIARLEAARGRGVTDADSG